MYALFHHHHRRRSNRKLLVLIAPTAIYVSIVGLTARAEPLSGLVATYYTIDEAPPNRNLDTYPVCATEIENNINRSYDGEPVDGCPTDLFAAHLTGSITIPEHETIEFFLASDDGAEATIGGYTFGSWQDQGCSATLTGELDLEPGETPLEAIFYENGGSTCFMLAWKIDSEPWTIVPDEAYTQQPTPDTTLPETTVPETTVPETTIPETTIPQTSSSSTSSTTTTTTQAPPPAPIYTPPATTTTSTTTEPSTTTTTEPPTTVPETTIPKTSLPIPSTSLVEPSPSTSNAPTTSLSTLTAPETLLEPPSASPEPAPLDAPEQATAAELVTALSNPETLANLTPEQAAEVFAELHVEDLTQQLADRLVDVLQDAPEEIRAEFENEIDVYSGLFDRYVPIGSTVPVSTRRTLTAVSGLALATAASVRIRR